MKLKDLPQPIRELAEKRIREQGNEPKPNTYLSDDKSEGGFDWIETEEGKQFWDKIDHGNFDVFYQLNPIEFITKKIDQLDSSDLAKVVEYIEEKIKKYKQDNGILTTDYLMSIHPSLSINEAKSLLDFCNKNTIYHVQCYGEGSIMLPLWKEYIDRFKNRGNSVMP